MEEVYDFSTSYFFKTTIVDVETIGDMTKRMIFNKYFEKGKDLNEKL